MAKLCRACQKLAADRGGVCDACRRSVSKDPVVPQLRPAVWKWAGLFVILLSVGSTLIAAVVLARESLPWRDQLSFESRPQPIKYEVAMTVEPVSRKVYPFSLVPGGAQNLDEAKQAMRAPGVKANYAGFAFDKLRQVKLRKPLVGYISYRWGEKIYWTSNILTLRPGETVFTDGVYLVRGRDLNCYSPVPRQPTQDNEPAEEVLDTPVEMPAISYSFPKRP